MAKHRPKIKPALRASVYVRDKWTCQYCGRVFVPEAENLTGRYAPWHRLPDDADLVYLELDHVHPRSLGGDDSEENLKAACTPCNKRKLGTTRHTKWELRIAMAREVLESQPPTEEAAKKAAALLLGYLQSELPPAKSMREAGF